MSSMILIVNLIASAMAADDVACFFGGHGPYPETSTSCLELTRNQALTDCNLSNRSARVHFTAKTKAGVILVEGICTSVYRKDQDTCRAATCSF